MEEKKTCFVVTPIGDDNTSIRRHINGIIDEAIIPAIGEEFQVKVAHREYEIGSINNRVIQSIYNSDLVIANLTGLNPNVMFEIAIRYSFGKPAIVIAEKGTKLPFDIVDENTIFYINDPAGAAELKENIKNFVEKIDLTKCEYGPVFSAIRNASRVNAIENGISGEGTQEAFTYLLEKIDDLEERLYSFDKFNNSKKKDFHQLTFNEMLLAAKRNEADWNELLQKGGGKVRVHEVAKKLNLSSKEVINIFSKLGISLQSHMSLISKDQICELLDYMGIDY